MKKIVLNISENFYSRLCFEAIEEKKSIQQLIGERMNFKQFSDEVEKAFDKHTNEQIEKIIQE